MIKNIFSFIFRIYFYNDYIYSIQNIMKKPLILTTLWLLCLSLSLPTYAYTDAEVEVMKIDYDLRLVISNGLKYMFSFNDKGYISQIGNCSCTYDSYGYLTGVENTLEIWTLAYNEGELIKSLISNIKNGNMQLYYMFYSENSDSGELMFYMNSEKYEDYIRDPIRAVMSFIAYQSGLFGKITKHCSYLSRSNETSAVLEKNNEQDSRKFIVHCKFTYE